MPRAKPGQRFGGRTKGTPNKATVEKAIIAEQVTQRAQMQGRKLAKEVLDDFMTVFTGMAARVQPTYAADGRTLIGGDPNEFERWAVHARDTATALAKYQSPTMRAIEVRQAPQEAPLSAGANVLDLVANKTPMDAANVYRRLIMNEPAERKKVG
jgi:hypothetical protein